jgi:hypothetical protein
MRLPAFRFLYLLEASRKEVSSFVIAGLDPAIHAAERLRQNLDWLLSRDFSMDHRAFAAPKWLRPRRRVKPGGDEELRRCLTLWIGKLARGRARGRSS